MKVEAVEKSQESILTRQIARLAAKYAGILPLAENGDADATVELLELHGLRLIAMEARTKLQPIGDQVKTLTKVLAGKKKYLARVESELADARQIVDEKEIVARNARLEMDKVALDLEAAEAQRTPTQAPKLELDTNA